MNEFNKKIGPIESMVYRLEVEINDSVLKQSEELKDLKNVSQDMILALRNDYDGKFRELSSVLEKQGEGVDISQNFIESSQEMFNSLSIGNAQQDSRIQTLESVTSSMDNKLGSLESADLFLQEAHRMLTDKTTFVEAESRKLIGTVNSSLEDHKEEIETNLKSQITLLLKDIEEINQEKLKTDEAIEKVEEFCYDNKNKIEEIENAMLQQNQDSNSKTQMALENFKDSYGKELDNLEEKIAENKSNIESNKVRIKNSAGSIHTIMDNLTTHNERFDNLDVTINENYTSFENYQNEVNSNLSQVGLDINDIRDNMQKVESKMDKSVSDIIEITSVHSRHISSLEASYANIEHKHVETIERMKEVTVLATNIEVHVKEQMKEQQSANMEGFDIKFEEINLARADLQSHLGELQISCQNILQRLDNVETTVDLEKEVSLGRNTELNSQLERNGGTIQDILLQFGEYDENNKLQAQKNPHD